MDALDGMNGLDMQQDPNMMMGQDDMMNQQPPMDANMEGDVEGFDAGVEVDAEEDPKKYIQQLTGKLSQELRKYNDEQEMPDEDLNKYVAGMIIPQASLGMTDKGKNEVIKKIKKGTTDDGGEDGDVQTEAINEIINNSLEDDFVDTRKQKRICNKTLPKKNPFRSNR